MARLLGCTSRLLWFLTELYRAKYPQSGLGSHGWTGCEMFALLARHEILQAVRGTVLTSSQVYRAANPIVESNTAGYSFRLTHSRLNLYIHVPISLPSRFPLPPAFCAAPLVR